MLTPNVCVVQNGAFYTAVTDSGNYMLKAFNYPKTGETGMLGGLQLGGFGFTIEPDASGVQKIKNFKDFLVGPEPVTIACKAGKIVLAPGFTKMNGQYEVTWALTQGPDKASTVPIHRETDDLKVGGVKKVSSASKQVVLELPGGETINAYVGRHQTQNIVKMDGSTLFEMGADGVELLQCAEKQEELLKLLQVPDLKMFLGLSKTKIPGKPKGASLNIFAQHDEINDGNPILLFASAPVAGPPPHILQSGAKGVLPGGKSLKNLMELPWIYGLRPVLEQLVKPLVDFAVYFDNCVAAKKWSKNVTRGIPPRMTELVLLLSKLYKSQAKDKVETLLGYVTTNVTSLEDGEWRSSGLALDPKLKKIMKGKRKAKDDSDEDDSDEDEDEGEESEEDASDVEELRTEGNGKGKGKAAKSGGKRERPESKSPAKSTRSSGSSSSGSAKKAKKAVRNKRQRLADMAVGSDDDADELGGKSDDE